MAETKGLQPSESIATDPEKARPDAAAIEEWIVGCLSEMLHVEAESIDVRRPFAYLGLGSADGVILAGDLERWLGGRRLSPTLAWDFPTIELLARHLAAGEDDGNIPCDETEPSGNEAVEDLSSEIKRPTKEVTPFSSGAALVRDEPDGS